MGYGAFGDGWEIKRGGCAYPDRLEDLASPPEIIYGRGDPSVLAEDALAIIGTRQMTPYGEAICTLAARMAVSFGIAVVSGGAIGCDSAAARSTLDEHGTNIIVLGTGADVIYPQRSEPLVEQTIAQGGAVISIERWGTQPRRYAFPKRNRIIAALSRAVFVAEAGMPSGTFSTAEAATEIDREVLAAPGSIFSPASRGSNYLIESGACIIADEEALSCALSRIFCCLRSEAAPGARTPALDQCGSMMLEALVATPLRVDAIARAAHIDTRTCLERLSELTLAGLVERMVDGRYAATAAALVNRTSFGAQ